MIRHDSQALSSGLIVGAQAQCTQSWPPRFPGAMAPASWAPGEQMIRQPSNCTCQGQVSQFPDQSISTSLPLIHTRVHTHTNVKEQSRPVPLFLLPPTPQAFQGSAPVHSGVLCRGSASEAVTLASVVLPGSPMTNDGSLHREVQPDSETAHFLADFLEFELLTREGLGSGPLGQLANQQIPRDAALVRPWGGPGRISAQSPCFQSSQDPVWAGEVLSWAQNQVSPPMCVYADSFEVGSGALGKGTQRAGAAW